VALGYLGRSALTAERFLPDPFGGVPGARVYRTGDLARWRADSALEFLGRLDEQAKIRGFRIEPAEVKPPSAHPEIRQAAVVAATGPAGDQRLVAYVVPTGGQAPDPSDLRRYLRARLPEYMVPAAYMQISASAVIRCSPSRSWLGSDSGGPEQ
jgi:acyl-coenzyme A synthetase/AMP-(fatty) acid ligase